MQCDQGFLCHMGLVSKPTARYLKYFKDYLGETAQTYHCVYKLSLYFCLPSYFTFVVRVMDKQNACVGACVRNCVWMCDGWMSSINVFFF